MNYTTLGDTSLKLSVVTFGAWAAGGWMWGGTEQNNAAEAIRTSYDLGVTSIDTAPAYGQGLSEEIVGEAVKNIPRDKVQILTKFGVRWDTDKGNFAFKSKDNDGNPINIHRYSGKESVIRECEQSLRRLRTDYIDLYQIHWPDTTTPIEETMEVVSMLKEQGKIREAGVSNYNVEQMKQAEEVVSIASNQVPYSMLKRDIEADVIPFCQRNNKGILAYSPLQRGVLTGKMKPGHVFEEGDTRSDEKFYTDENIRRINKFLDSIRPIAREKNISLPQLVISWTLSQPGISVALVGARNPKQATENAKAAEIDLSKDELNRINTNLEDLELAYEE